MTDLAGRAARLVAEIDAEVPALRRIAEEAARARDRVVTGDAMACSHAALQLHRWYTGVEGLLERIERALGVPPSPGPGWHRELLRGATLELPRRRPSVIAPATELLLVELLSFRHFIRHAYAVALDPARLVPLLDRLAEAQPAIERDLGALAEQLRAAAATSDGS